MLCAESNIIDGKCCRINIIEISFNCQELVKLISVNYVCTYVRTYYIEEQRLSRETDKLKSTYC